MPIRMVVVNGLRPQFNIVVQTALSKIIVGGITIQQADLKPSEAPRESPGDFQGKGLIYSEWPPEKPKRKMHVNGSHTPCPIHC